MVPLDAAHATLLVGGCNEHVRAYRNTRRASWWAFGGALNSCGRYLRRITRRCVPRYAVAVRRCANGAFAACGAVMMQPTQALRSGSASVVGAALLRLSLWLRAADAVGSKCLTRLHEEQKAVLGVDLRLERRVDAAAAAPLWGILLESRAAMVSLGAWRAAAALGCNGAYGQARSWARRERREVVTGRWFAPRC